MKSLRNMFAAVGSFLLIGLFVVSVAPVQAAGVENRIKALEQELQNLKGEQVEAREEALAARKKMPSFRYRTRSGVWITAPDKSWSTRISARYHGMVFNHIDGKDKDGYSVGDLESRRNRLDWRFCWENCFYAFRFGIDGDNGTMTSLTIQNMELAIRLDRLNPSLPRLWISDAGGQSHIGAGTGGRSSHSNVQVELAGGMLSDDAKDGLSSRGFGAHWSGLKFGPGTWDMSLALKPGGGINRDDDSDTDHKQVHFKLWGRPFRKSKVGFLKAVRLGYSIQAEQIDADAGQSGDRIRLSAVERRGDPTIFTANNIGDGLHTSQEMGFRWDRGPYQIRLVGGKSNYKGENDAYRGAKAYYWGIANQLFIYSPKGAFTGRAHRKGSLAIGYTHMRADAECGADACDASGGRNGNYIYANEVGMWYWVRPGLSVGTWFLRNTVANMPAADQITTGCSNNTNTTLGKECSWESINLGLRFDW